MVLFETFGAAADRNGMRLVHYSIQGDHIHSSLFIKEDPIFLVGVVDTSHVGKPDLPYPVIPYSYFSCEQWLAVAALFESLCIGC